MGDIQTPQPVLLLAAIFSKHDDAFEWAKRRAVERWGPIALSSPVFKFDFTTYYEAEMGDGLRKMFIAMEQLMDPAELPSRKIESNQWECDYAASSEVAEPRPLNVDPGYLTEAKLVLATTKDRDHRLYLSDGIYAEGTLFYHHGAWQERPWTYPDYRDESYHAFFSLCRKYLRERMRSAERS